jgi:hypothetical protein
VATTGLILVSGGQLRLLSALVSPWLNTLRAGLFQNDWWPQVSDNIGRYTPADFPGYDGLHIMVGWYPPVLDGDIATITGFPRVWTRSAGYGGGWVFGYYVVDQAGVLVWAERTEPEGIVIGRPGDTFTISPVFGMGTRYTGA